MSETSRKFEQLGWDALKAKDKSRACYYFGEAAKRESSQKRKAILTKRVELVTKDLLWWDSKEERWSIK